MKNIYEDSFAEKDELFEKKIKKLIEMIKFSKNMTVFTGAGVSTLSGIPDFRGKHGVYTDPWNGLDVEQIISISFFKRKPDVFYKWAKDVWYHLEDYNPNIVHYTLSKLQDKGFLKNIYTQNIDMLHHKAGSKNVYEIHGSPLFHHCTLCGEKYSYSQIAPIVCQDKVPYCRKCNGIIKPDIIFYEESLNEKILEYSFNDFTHTDLCLVLGSSLLVQPAAMFPQLAVQNNAKLVIVNAQETFLDQNAVLLFKDLKQTFTALSKWLEEMN